MRIEEVVHYANDAQREEHAQVVQVPAHLQGRRCSDNRITRTALVKGSRTVRSSYLPLGYQTCGIWHRDLQREALCGGTREGEDSLGNGGSGA